VEVPAVWTAIPDNRYFFETVPVMVKALAELVTRNIREASAAASVKRFLLNMCKSSSDGVIDHLSVTVSPHTADRHRSEY
jgi:hypothetical protein